VELALYGQREDEGLRGLVYCDQLEPALFVAVALAALYLAAGHDVVVQLDGQFVRVADLLGLYFSLFE
jgi:hypothetical protein